MRSCIKNKQTKEQRFLLLLKFFQSWENKILISGFRDEQGPLEGSNSLQSGLLSHQIKVVLVEERGVASAFRLDSQLCRGHLQLGKEKTSKSKHSVVCIGLVLALPL